MNLKLVKNPRTTQWIDLYIDTMKSAKCIKCHNNSDKMVDIWRDNFIPDKHLVLTRTTQMWGVQSAQFLTPFMYFRNKDIIIGIMILQGRESVLFTFCLVYCQDIITSCVSGQGNRIGPICVFVCVSVCEHSHTWTVWPMTAPLCMCVCVNP